MIPSAFISADARSLVNLRQVGFNVPFWRADDPLWQDHPMVNETEMLWTESTTKDVMG